MFDSYLLCEQLLRQWRRSPLPTWHALQLWASKRKEGTPEWDSRHCDTLLPWGPLASGTCLGRHKRDWEWNSPENHQCSPKKNTVKINILLLFDGLTDWLTDRQGRTDRRTDKQTDWLSEWLTDWVSDKQRQRDGRIDRLTVWVTDYLTDWLTDRQSNRWMDGRTDRQSDWRTVWLTDWLAGWLNNWLTD